MGRSRTSVEEEGRALVERLGGRWTASGGMCRCPAHEDRTPSLSVRPGRQRLLLHCFAGCDSSDVLRALQSGRLLEAGPRRSGDAREGRSDRALNPAALVIWSEARSIDETPAALYLRSRGLDIASSELRYHPRTPHGPKPLTQFRPALIAAVRDSNGLAAIHRTFIEPAGRGLAVIANPRCGLGRFGSGAVRLGGLGPQLGLAEGIETALSASSLFKIPCWATLGAERFGSVSIPADVERLILFLDRDSGGRSAEALARKAFGRDLQIEALYPDRRGEDWNDVLSRRGKPGPTRARGGERKSARSGSHSPP
jgi:hypothetical protein